MATSVQTGKAKQLTLLGFFAITASMVMAVYEYPTFATSGFSLVFFLLLGGILWFIPVGLCAAEMATVDGWEEGGVFAWVSNTLGPRWGFAAISFGYLQIAIGFIPMLYFVLGALSYILKWPALNEDPITKTIAALIILWALALTQFGGTKYTARIAKVGFFAGILLPAFIFLRRPNPIRSPQGTVPLPVQSDRFSSVLSHPASLSPFPEDTFPVRLRSGFRQ